MLQKEINNSIKNDLIKTINSPKAELHIHLEGCLEPEMILNIAKRNGIPIKHKTTNEIKDSYKFNNLKDFLNLYYQGISILKTEEDYFELTYAYLSEAHKNNITYTEMFIDPQAHIIHGVPLKNIFQGIERAIILAKKNYSINANLIVSFLRHLSQDNALKVFDQIMEFRNNFIGIGLDSSELGNPPNKFKLLFDKARIENLKLVAHAGEEGPASYVWEALDILGVNRIDHGNAICTDKELVHRIIKDQIALTMCPLSNHCLKVVSDLKNHQALTLLNQGVKITINSDDPAYFGGYLNKNFFELTKSLSLTVEDIEKLIKNSFEARFII